MVLSHIPDAWSSATVTSRLSDFLCTNKPTITVYYLVPFFITPGYFHTKGLFRAMKQNIIRNQGSLTTHSTSEYPHKAIKNRHQDENTPQNHRITVKESVVTPCSKRKLPINNHQYVAKQCRRQPKCYPEPGTKTHNPIFY